MAKYRCPSCGAAHKEPPATCRLCGYVMDGSVATAISGPTAAAPPPENRSALGLAVIGIVVVLVLGIGALVLHVSSGNATVTKAIDKLPGTGSTPTGWKVVTDAAGGFTVQLPPDPTTTSVAFPGADNGQLTGWQATVGDAPQVDTILYVIYGKVHPNPGETASSTVTRLGLAKLARDPGYVESKTLGTYQGYPAISYTMNRVNFRYSTAGSSLANPRGTRFNGSPSSAPNCLRKPGDSTIARSCLKCPEMCSRTA